MRSSGTVKTVPYDDDLHFAHYRYRGGGRFTERRGGAPYNVTVPCCISDNTHVDRHCGRALLARYSLVVFAAG